jgi:hypothetical protein
MDPRWFSDFAAFAADVGPDPGSGFEIGRIDNDKGYAPGNVEWQTHSKNMRNKRSTVWVEHAGEKMSLAEACERCSMDYRHVWQRVYVYGWPLERALRP